MRSFVPEEGGIGSLAGHGVDGTGHPTAVLNVSDFALGIPDLRSLHSDDQVVVHDHFRVGLPVDVEAASLALDLRAFVGGEGPADALVMDVGRGVDRDVVLVSLGVDVLSSFYHLSAAGDADGDGEVFIVVLGIEGLVVVVATVADSSVVKH